MTQSTAYDITITVYYYVDQKTKNGKSFLSRVCHVLIRFYPYNLILRFFFMGKLWIFRLSLTG